MTNESSKTAAEPQIRKLIEDRAAALRAKDPARVVANYAPNIVHFSLAPPLISAGEDAPGLNAWFATWRGPLGYEICDLEIMVGGDVAFSHSLNRLSGTKVDGEKAEVWFRRTLGFRKIGGQWKFVQSTIRCRSTWTAAIGRRST
jgi:PhnB protein